MVFGHFGPISGKLGSLRSEPYPVSPGTGQVCQFFKKSGWCKWGDECRYQHVHGPETPVGVSPTVEKSGEVCQFFTKSGWCKYADKCKHEHIDGNEITVQREPCNFFAKSGWCQYGDGCKYEHIHGHDTPIVAKTNGLSQPDEVCQFFGKAGWCKFGDLCRYQHIFEGAEAPQEKSGEICQFFTKSGWCKYGDNCKHEHIGEARPNESNGGPREACQFFSKSGWCQYGNSCKYLHLPGSGPVAPGNPRSGPGRDQETCQFFAKSGWCKYGDACNFIHIGKPKTNLQTTELSGAQVQAAAAALMETPGMQKAEAMALDLSEDAVKALLTLPSMHASELLETVAEKHETLRDPSNYVVSTIARGYIPRAFWQCRWQRFCNFKRSKEQRTDLCANMCQYRVLHFLGLMCLARVACLWAAR